MGMATLDKAGCRRTPLSLGLGGEPLRHQRWEKSFLLEPRASSPGQMQNTQMGQVAPVALPEAALWKSVWFTAGPLYPKQTLPLACAQEILAGACRDLWSGGQKT